ncbi:hypothetical protein Mterra_01258 [Calidithermus terrae]|uniref:Outer membrane protein beta-barrel domain protein n=1 Tax=Calidithermus terrae TaxID=1408545 RepID=A0A399EVT8_9DEIN|nr:hypothetical protein [Calidithermus terrae]RIH87199.1 hypothetical protein Mterra_01258 [Calidithermus terrae]
MKRLLFLLSLLASFALAQGPQGPQNPQRNPAYFGGYAFTDGAGGWLLGIVGGNDSVLENFGVRLEVNVPLGPTPASLSLLGTWRYSQGRVDSYTGVGLGVAKADQGYLMGQLVLGGNLHLGDHLALFLEGQYRYLLPAGAYPNTAQVLLGLQYRVPAPQGGGRP